MVHALPLILGIEHLSDDLVLLATRGRANVLTARIDLNALSERMVWAAVQHALIKADAERVHVLVYPEAPVTGQVLASLHEDLGHLATGTPRGLKLVGDHFRRRAVVAARPSGRGSVRAGYGRA